MSQAKVKQVKMSELVTSMTQELDYYWSLGIDRDYGTECLVYKVQKHIRESDRFSYEPCVVSVGPYHHGSASLLGMEKVKWGYLDVIVRLNSHRNLLDYLTTVEALSKQARSCYSEDINMDSESFLQMLLLDGCYILCSLGAVTKLVESRLEHHECSNIQETVAVGEVQSEHQKTEDIIAENVIPCEESIRADDRSDTQSNHQTGCWFIRFINHDLLLLENQIPFFILETIFQLVTDNCASPPCLTDELAKYVETALRWYPKAIMGSDRPKKFHHLLHLSHIYFQPTQRHGEDQNYQFGHQHINRFLSFGRKYFRISYLIESNDHDASYHDELNVSQGGNQLNRWRRAAQYIEAGIKFKKRAGNMINSILILC
ncbi:hypothetical protein ACP4OV_026152 [Aristida adscensionis]